MRSGPPLVFAHRGGAALAPENTLVAFDRGLALGADGLELDVRLSRDGHVVVMHDATLARTTDATGELARRTIDELATIDAGYRFAADGAYPYRNRGVRIPTLAVVLARYPGARIIIELKVNNAQLAREALRVVHDADACDRVCFGSASRGVLREIRRLEPRVATSAAREEVRIALYRSWCRWPVGPTSQVPYVGFQVPERAGATRVVSPRFVTDAHRAGLGVQVWTVDDADDARRLLLWGVDALITDRPDIMVPLVRGA